MEAFERISEEIRACTKCPLHAGRTQAVPGVGNVNADIVFVGEAPGQKEDELGEPFVGAAGKLLDKLLASIDLNRSGIYITNAAKCRPPENRDPTDEEKSACRPFLDRQLAIIRPKLIVTLGRHAMYNFLPQTFRISEVHGQPKRVIDPETRVQKYIVYPVYHPAAALYNGSQLSTLQKDFLRIPKIVVSL